MRRQILKSWGHRIRARRLVLERLEGRCLLVTGPVSGLANIYGLSFGDGNLNAQWDDGEQPVSGIEMRLYDAQGQLAGSCTSMSAENGTAGLFYFLNLPAGRYTLTAARGTAPATTPFPVQLELSPGDLAVANRDLMGSPGENQTKVVIDDLNVGLAAASQFTIERDRYTLSSGKFVIDDGTLRETVTLIGPGQIDAYFEGPQEGDARDDSGNGLDEVALQLVEWQLTGNSSRGTVNVVLDPRQSAWGVIEEQTDSQTGRLDVRPFAAQGTAAVTLDVGATVQIGTQVYYLAAPLRLTAAVTQKPAGSGESYAGTMAVPLLDAAGQATNLTITSATWTPSPSRPWQNPRSPFDVDNDGQVKASDVLTIINFLNTYGPHELTPPPQPPLVPPPFLDIDGNGQINPADVLQLINQLNAVGPYVVPFETVTAPLAAPQPVASATPAGEGEAAPSPRVTVASVSSAVQTVPAPSAEAVAQREQRGAKSRLSRVTHRSAIAGIELSGEEFDRELESTLGEISPAIAVARQLRA